MCMSFSSPPGQNTVKLNQEQLQYPDLIEYAASASLVMLFMPPANKIRWLSKERIEYKKIGS